MTLSNTDQLSDTIDQTRELLAHLENNEIEDAQSLIDSFSSNGDEDLFKEIGKLTRNLHEAMSNFQMDSKITDLAASEIPDAKERLNYVIEKTEEAANKTMDKVESCTARSILMAKESDELLVEWKKPYNRELEPGDFRKLSDRIEKHLIKNKNDADSIHSELTEVLMAQDYQDLTGQVIRQVITLVQDVEESMVHIIKMFGSMDGYNAAKDKVVIKDGVEGPVVNSDKRNDVVQGQDQVDDLLSSLGF
ncbi:MAG: protein phosphatase CheZ [Kangiellaceae bacterium]|nr:protein phosphatase CheZ [Kangiellaceae bacterium]